eukprot:scaffold2582_cov162-Ochromonas_danica.AAC.21
MEMSSAKQPRRPHRRGRTRTEHTLPSNRVSQPVSQSVSQSWHLNGSNGEGTDLDATSPSASRT